MISARSSYKAAALCKALFSMRVNSSFWCDLVWVGKKHRERSIINQQRTALLARFLSIRSLPPGIPSIFRGYFNLPELEYEK
jgi:hypothetical protein